jgi:hypothetical protein
LDGPPTPLEEIHEQTRERVQERGDKESPKACTHLKSCEPLYTCPRILFYRETNGLLHPRLPSDLKNIQIVNMYINVFYIP